MARTPVRRAAASDITELVRLRHAMFADMAESGAAARPDAVEDSSWYPAATEALQRRIAEGSLVACVIDDPGARGGEDPRLIGCAVAQLVDRLPGPGFPSGLAGSLSSIYVEPSHRAHGYGRMLTKAALDWLRHAGAEVVDLHATPDSERLYRSLGFTDPASRAMRQLLS